MGDCIHDAEDGAFEEVGEVGCEATSMRPWSPTDERNPLSIEEVEELLSQGGLVSGAVRRAAVVIGIIATGIVGTLN